MGNFFGGLFGGLSSLIGGFMNTSSQQAINQQNIQNSQWAAQGGYLPGLVMNANKAGINPLAVLGQHAPSIAQAVGTEPGRGLEQLGAEMFRTPHQSRMEDADYLRARIDIANARQAGNNAAIRGAVDSYLLDYLVKNKAIPEGVQQPTLTGLGAGWMSRLLDPTSWSGFRPGNAVSPDRGQYNTP